jgi:hypothetical protein
MFADSKRHQQLCDAYESGLEKLRSMLALRQKK